MHLGKARAMPTTPSDEDITMLGTLMPASSPNYKSSPTWTVCSVRIQQIALHSNDDISLIRRPNKVFLDVLET